MTIKLTVPVSQDHIKPKIAVIGVGGAGGNAINKMISSGLEGVEFVTANTDAQALAQTGAERKIQLGLGVTNGLGAGSRPEIGRASAEEAMEEIVESLSAAHMVFVTAGMGGGTGTGAAPVIAQVAREHGILTVGVVTKPFQFEGMNRMQIAEAGIQEMQQYVDTLIVIPNQNLFRIANENTSFSDAFTMADEVLHSGVRGLTDLMVVPGLINLDFADIRTVMGEMGKAMMGTGEGEGEDRARLAAEAAISNPLLDDVSMKGALGVLINITGGPDMTLFEVDEAANRIGEEVDPNANIIFGSTMDEKLLGKMRVSVVATGIEISEKTLPKPVLTVYSQSLKETSIQNDETIDQRADLVEKEPTKTQELKGSENNSQYMEKILPAQKQQAASRPSTNNFNKTAAIGASSGPSEIKQPVFNPDLSSHDKLDDLAHTNEPEEPHLVSENDAFLPPRPVDPQTHTQTNSAADPFKEADLLNTANPVEKNKRSSNLFQRITGVRRERTVEHPNGKNNERLEPVLGPDKEPLQQQSKFSSLDSKEQINNSNSDEDLLDIPAFLRRQAN